MALHHLRCFVTVVEEENITARIHLTKHRVGRLLKKEVQLLSAQRL